MLSGRFGARVAPHDPQDVTHTDVEEFEGGKGQLANTSNSKSESFAPPSLSQEHVSTLATPERRSRTILTPTRSAKIQPADEGTSAGELKRTSSSGNLVKKHKKKVLTLMAVISIIAVAVPVVVVLLPESGVPVPGPELPASEADAVKATFTLSGSVSDYGEDEVAKIAQTVADGAGVATSAVQIAVESASVKITATIAVAAGAATSTASSLSSGILASASALETALVSAGMLGVTVEDTPLAVVVTSPKVPAAIDREVILQKIGGAAMSQGGKQSLVPQKGLAEARRRLDQTETTYTGTLGKCPRDSQVIVEHESTPESVYDGTTIFSTVDMINCLMSLTKPSAEETVNQGPYTAVVNENLCMPTQESDAGASAAGGESSGSAPVSVRTCRIQ